ncbi:MAG: hypothetical protein EXS37_13085 [Opitutus sp.]|nr:hypothetical protein [Opitutus sp.]
MPLWSALDSENLIELVARLRAAGFPPNMVRAIVDAQIERRFSGRIRDLTRSFDQTPYWKPEASFFYGSSKVFEELNQIYRERSRALRELLGKDALAYGGTDPSSVQRRQYGNLTQAKIDLVQRVTDDYAEMTGQISTATQGIMLPEDREKLAFLEREKRADLAAMFTPEELADHAMRTSPATSRLRTALTVMDATEDEFRKLHQFHQPFSELLYPAGGFTVFTAELSEKRREAQNQINDQFRAAFGDRRLAEYQRATNTEFQQLYRLGQRDNVAYDTLVRAFDARGPAAEASLKISRDQALSYEQKRAALAELAQTTRTLLLSTLGPGAGPAYVESSRWLRQIEQGGAVSITPDGNLSYHSISPPAKKPTP